MKIYPIVGPAGSNGEVQFNKNQLFGADSNLFWDDTNKYLGIQTNAPEVTLNLETGNVQIGMQADSYYCTLSTNSLSFNRASGASYINQEGVGGSIICRVSNAGVNDRTAFTVANTGNVTFGYSITAANYTAANLLTACATNAGELDFTVASKKLDVEDNAVVSQDYTSDATPTFAGLTFTGGAFSLTPSTGDTDVVITFAGTTFSGVLRWMEDEDYFKFDDKVICPNLDVATLTETRRLNINNGESSALTSFSSPIIYGTSGGGGSYPFNEAGNLVLSPRLSGANRDVLFITDSAGSNIAMVIQESGYVGFGETAPETFSEWTSTAPYLTLHNSTHEDADGGQESRLIFKGEDSAGSEEIIAQIEASKDAATATENAGKLVFSTRESVANGDTLTECFRLSADGSALFQNNTDSTTGFQVLDADGGTPVLNVDTTNERIGIQTDAPETVLNLETGSIQVGMQADAYFTTLATNALSFNRAGSVSYINQEGIGGSLRIRTSEVGVNDIVAMQFLATGVATLYKNVGFGGETGPETLLEMTSTAPYLTLHNSTEEDGDGGRESRINFKGEQSGTEETTLARIEVSHDGAADDQKGKIVISTNDGADADTPTNRLEIESAGVVKFLNTGGLPFGSVYGNEIGWTQTNAVQNTWYEISDAQLYD
jgi:hypothetical protein